MDYRTQAKYGEELTFYQKEIMKLMEGVEMGSVVGEKLNSLFKNCNELKGIIASGATIDWVKPRVKDISQSLKYLTIKPTESPDEAVPAEVVVANSTLKEQVIKHLNCASQELLLAYNHAVGTMPVLTNVPSIQGIQILAKNISNIVLDINKLSGV